MRPYARDSEDGATATEYVVLVMLIAIVIIGGATYFGSVVNAKYSDAGTTLQN